MIRAIVTDIEGTTSSIEFVHDVLFPYARARLREFLRLHAADTAVRAELLAIDALIGRALSVDDCATLLEQWIDEDRKITPLKTLQGLIWRAGYEAGELKGHVFADVPAALARWHAAGTRLYVYSSGSEAAQRLIFGYSVAGDLTPLFSGYFDTRIGPKTEPASYRRIVAELGIPADAILFLSDTARELHAARAVGMRTCQVVRDDRCERAADHPRARDFSEVDVSHARS